MNAAFLGARACNKQETAVPNCGFRFIPDCSEFSLLFFVTAPLTTLNKSGAFNCKLASVWSQEKSLIAGISTSLHSEMSVSGCKRAVTSFLTISLAILINCLFEPLVASNRPLIALPYCLARIAVMMVSHLVLFLAFG